MEATQHHDVGPIPLKDSWTPISDKNIAFWIVVHVMMLGPIVNAILSSSGCSSTAFWAVLYPVGLWGSIRSIIKQWKYPLGWCGLIFYGFAVLVILFTGITDYHNTIRWWQFRYFEFINSWS